MRMSRMMLKTHKAVASEAELPSHQLLLRAGLARRVAAGIYSLSPLAFRVIRSIEAVVREEMERIGGQELLLPVVQPADLWRESGRYDSIGAELARFTARGNAPMVLAMTHEEAVTDLARSVIESHRQLPQMVFQFQTKFRDEPRPRAGLVRLREFLMKDAYSFHASQDDLDTYYDRVVEAYTTIFRRLELPVLVVEADCGMMGGTTAHEFMLMADGGEDTLLVCSSCGYAANQEVAVARTPPVAGTDVASTRQGSGELYTPGATTIAALCAATGRSPDQTLKSVFYAAGDDAASGELVVALIRGDLDVNAIKLRNVLGREVRTLSHDEARQRGLVAGYAGPVGLSRAGRVRLVADATVQGAGGLVAGANRVDYHIADVSYGRDYEVDATGDIALARPDDGCIRCGTPLEVRRGIEAANTFKLGTHYSETMGATFPNEEGIRQPIVMGCYGIGITRALACLLEQHHDRDGIIWPATVAPYAYALLATGSDPAVRQGADRLHDTLGGERTLYDDREVSVGVKLKDADLLGMPVRVLVSARSLAAGGAELCVRRTGERRIVPLAEAPAVASALLRGV